MPTRMIASIKRMKHGDNRFANKRRRVVDDGEIDAVRKGLLQLIHL